MYLQGEHRPSGKLLDEDNDGMFVVNKTYHRKLKTDTPVQTDTRYY